MFIRRRAAPISLAEWRDTVERTDDVRLAGGPDLTGAAEMFIAPLGEWRGVFLWRAHQGDIGFEASPDFDEPDDSLRMLATLLAAQLGAAVVDDDGEIYD